MFDFVRKHNRVMQFLLFLLIFPSFVLFGLEGYNRFRDKGDVVANVDGQEIHQAEWDEAHKRQVDQLRAQMPTLDAKMLESPEAKYATLEGLVRERVMAAAAIRSNISASDQRVARELQSNQTIAALRRPDGSLDMAAYRQLLATQGMTPEMYESRLRNDISVRQVLAGISGTGFPPAAPADLALNAFLERREVQMHVFDPSNFSAQVKPTDAELQSFYDANPALFQAPEQANIEYLVLDLDAVRQTVAVSDADLKTYFEQNQARLAGTEERRARHILINAPKAAPAAERQAARTKAEQLLVEVRKAPQTFGDVAKKNSQDTGSAPSGGDLDFFTKGAMVNKPFEDKVFAMNKGDISDIVETEFGYHIIQLTDIRAPKQRSFEEMKPELEAELRKQQAQRKFAETAEAFTNSVYEQADSLKPTADRLKLPLRTATGVARVPATGASGALANTRFLNALFAPDSVEKKRNTEALELAPSRLASGRVTQYTPARTLPFAEVKDKVRERLVLQKATELAKKEGEAKLAAWKAKPDDAQLSPAMPVTRQDARKLPPQLVDAVMRADSAALPAFVGVDLLSQGYAVARVNKLLPREAMNADATKGAREQYSAAWTAAESAAYYQVLRDRYKVKILAAKPAAKTGETALQ